MYLATFQSNISQRINKLQAPYSCQKQSFRVIQDFSNTSSVIHLQMYRMIGEDTNQLLALIETLKLTLFLASIITS